MRQRRQVAAGKTAPQRSHFNLEEHVAAEHSINPLTTYIKEIVYGGTDGIITTFAIVAGFAGAQTNPSSQLPLFAILLFGFANLFADGISMALGNFMSTRSEQDVYKHAKEKEYHEVVHNPEMEKAETLVILQKKGFTKKQAADLVAIYATNPMYWTEFMMNNELELSNPEGDNPFFMALATFFSFLVFGFIPLSPYVILGEQATFVISIGATATALLSLGFIRWRVGRQGALRSIGEVLLLGGAAAITAYFVGLFFRV